MNIASEHHTIILSPHLDDAVFSLGGLLATHPQHTTVITIFAGTPTTPLSRHWDRACGFMDSTEAIRTRKEEDISALKSLGIQLETIVHWEYLDKQYRKDTKENLSVLRKEIEEQIEIAIRAHAGILLHIYSPLIGIHSDHRIVRDAINNVYTTKFEKDPTITLSYYQDMPYIFRLYMLRRIALFFYSKKAVLSTFTPFLCIQTNITFDAVIQKRKIAAIKKYVSQFRSKFSDISFLIKTATQFAATQALAFRSRHEFSEVVYRKKKSNPVQE